MSEPAALVSAVIRKFRELNPAYGRTIIALSGGADSVALMFCLSRLKNVRLLAVHVTHDIRTPEETEHDYRVAKAAAEKCGVDFLRVYGPVINGCKFGTTGHPVYDEETNVEARARHVRYYNLNRLVNLNICSQPGQNFIRRDHFVNRSGGYIATAHHADDQLETMLMRIGRGTGIQGLQCIHESMNDFYEHSHRIIRPMLRLSRADCENICRTNGLEWTTDQTNFDKKYVRNRIRADVIPILREMFPNIAEHASSLAMVAGSAQETIERVLAKEVRTDYNHWLPEGREACFADSLRLQTDIVIYQWIAHACRHVAGSSELDNVNGTMVEDLIRAIRKRQTKTFIWPGRIIEVTPELVKMRRMSSKEKQVTEPARSA